MPVGCARFRVVLGKPPRRESLRLPGHIQKYMRLGTGGFFTCPHQIYMSVDSQSRLRALANFADRSLPRRFLRFAALSITRMW
jgi:hypothetical protein